MRVQPFGSVSLFRLKAYSSISYYLPSPSTTFAVTSSTFPARAMAY
jgi:hypothetical protein